MIFLQIKFGCFTTEYPFYSPVATLATCKEQDKDFS